MFTWLFTKVVGWGVKLASSTVLKNVIATWTGTSDNATQIALAELQAEIAARQNARDIRLATASFWEMRLVTFVIAGCATLHFAAVTLDTVFKFGWGIPRYPSPMDEWEGAILLSFFGVQLAQKGLSTLGAIFLQKRR